MSESQLLKKKNDEEYFAFLKLYFIYRPKSIRNENLIDFL